MDYREVDIVAAAFCPADWRALTYEARRPYRIAALQAIKALDAHRAARAEVSQDEQGPDVAIRATAGASSAARMPFLMMSGIGGFVLAALLVVTSLARQPEISALTEALAQYGP